MKETDLIIIGAGPGGYRAAELAAKAGLKVVIFEADEVGGTCLNVGCIPTKAFARNAELIQQLKSATEFGLCDLSYQLDFQQVIARKNQVVSQLRQGVEAILAHPNITLVRQRVHFVDAHTIAVATSDSVIPLQSTYTAPHIIIATGSENKVLPDLKGYCTHEQLLEMKQLPKRLCIIGSGVIGMEFASIFSSFGVDVTVVEFMKECLPALDSDIAKRLRKVLEKRGVVFHMQCAVKQIEEHDLGKMVSFENKKGQIEQVEADCVLMAVGRKPRVSDDFQNAGFEYDERQGIKVTSILSFETTVKGIYAIGDVNGLSMLAHAAEWQARQAVNAITMAPPPLIGTDGPHIPAAIFTNPEAACVGLSEDACQAKGIDYECHKAFYRANGKAIAMGETEGMVKLLSELGKGRIIGCHVFGAHAADLVQEVSVLMCRDTTVAQLRDMVHIHPTLSEILLTAAEQ